MAVDLNHKLLTNTALPYISNLSPTDPTPRYVQGSNALTSIKGYAQIRPALLLLFAFTQYSPGVIRRIYQWQRWNGDIFIMASVVDTTGPTSRVLKYKVGTDADWILLSVANDATTSEPYDYAVSNNHVFFCNGVSRFKYDGTTVTNWGITGPTAALTLTQPGGATLTGDYQYVIAWLNNTTGHVSSPSPVASITMAGNDTTLSGNTTADTQVTHVNIYRTAAGGSVLFKHPASPIVYATWVASGYVDATADTALNTTVIAPMANQNNRPPAMYGLEWYQGRLWGFADDKVYYSGFEEIPLGTSDMIEECFPPDNYFPFGRQLTGVAATGDPAKDGILGVYSAGPLFYVSGDSLNTFARGKVAEGIGTRNRATIAKYRKLTAWLASTNTVQVFDGARIHEISIPIRPDLISINHSRSAMFAHTNGSDQWLILGIGGASADPTTLLVYDLDREQWMPPWVMASGAMNAGGSLETAAGVFRAVLSATNTIVEFLHSVFKDGATPGGSGGNAYAAQLTLNAMELPSRPDHIAAVRYVGIERASTGTTVAKLLTDDDPASGTYTDLSLISGNPLSDPRRTQGAALVDSRFGTESGPWCRRASVRLSWAAAEANFKLYTVDVAYEEQ